VVLALLAPALAGAGGLEQGEELFGQMEYEKALKCARGVIRSPQSGPGDLVAAYRLEGLCLSALGKPQEALVAFRRLLAIQPGYSLQGDFSPKLTAPFYQAMAMSREGGPIALKHVPPKPAALGGLGLEVTLADPVAMVRSIRLVYLTRQGQREVVARQEGPGKIVLSLPDDFGSVEVAYFFEARNTHRGVVARAGTRESPFRLKVKPPVAKRPPPPQKRPAPAVTPPPSPPPAWAATGKDEKPTRKDEEEEGGFYTTWWFWTAVGVVVAGAAVGTGVALSGGESDGSVDYPVTIVVGE
jgi:hypothetical protein